MRWACAGVTVSPIFADEDVPERPPTVTKSTSGRGLRIEVRVFDEGVEFPPRSSYDPDNPRVYMTAYTEVQRDAFSSARALANTALLEFFAGYPLEVGPPRTAEEKRHERIRSGHVSTMDLMFEDAAIGPDGKIEYRGEGGYGRPPWEKRPR